MTLLADKPSSPNFTVAQLIMELSTMPQNMVVLVERTKSPGKEIYEIEAVSFHHTDDENQVVILEVQ